MARLVVVPRRRAHLFFRWPCRFYLIFLHWRSSCRNLPSALRTLKRPTLTPTEELPSDDPCYQLDPHRRCRCVAQPRIVPRYRPGSVLSRRHHRTGIGIDRLCEAGLRRVQGHARVSGFCVGHQSRLRGLGWALRRRASRHPSATGRNPPRFSRELSVNAR